MITKTEHCGTKTISALPLGHLSLLVLESASVS